MAGFVLPHNFTPRAPLGTARTRDRDNTRGGDFVYTLAAVIDGCGFYEAMQQTPSPRFKLPIHNIAERKAILISPYRCRRTVGIPWQTVRCKLSVTQSEFPLNQYQPIGRRSDKELQWDRAGETFSN